MIDPHLLAEAIRTSAEGCLNECAHQKAIEENTERIDETIMNCVMYALSEGISPALMVASAFLHIGYRLHQLEHQPLDHTKAN